MLTDTAKGICFSLPFLAGMTPTTSATDIRSLKSSCLTLERGDSPGFGSAIAMTDDVLAIGDPLANRVVLYTLKGTRWVRSMVIRAPANSSVAPSGEGFGRSLAMDGTRLLIGVHAERVPGVADRTTGDPADYISELFVARVEATGNVSVQTVPLAKADAARFSFGHAIAIDGDHAAVGLIDRSDAHRGKGAVALIDIANGATRILDAPQGLAMAFGGMVALRSGLLVASSPFAGQGAPVFLRRPGHGNDWQRPLSMDAAPMRNQIDTLTITPTMVVSGGRPTWIAPVIHGKVDVFRRVPGSEERNSVVAAHGERLALLDSPPLQIEDQGSPPPPPFLRLYRWAADGPVVERPPLLVRSIDATARRRTIAMTSKWIAVAAPTRSAPCSIVLLEGPPRTSRGDEHE